MMMMMMMMSVLACEPDGVTGRRQYLTFEEKLEVMPFVTDPIRFAFLRDNPDVTFVDLRDKVTNASGGWGVEGIPM
jgi:hypothetical protein